MLRPTIVTVALAVAVAVVVVRGSDLRGVGVRHEIHNQQDAAGPEARNEPLGGEGQVGEVVEAEADSNEVEGAEFWVRGGEGEGGG